MTVEVKWRCFSTHFGEPNGNSSLTLMENDKTYLNRNLKKMNEKSTKNKQTYLTWNPPPPGWKNFLLGFDLLGQFSRTRKCEYWSNHNAHLYGLIHSKTHINKSWQLDKKVVKTVMSGILFARFRIVDYVTTKRKRGGGKAKS